MKINSSKFSSMVVVTGVLVLIILLSILKQHQRTNRLLKTCCLSQLGRGCRLARARGQSEAREWYSGRTGGGVTSHDDGRVRHRLTDGFVRQYSTAIDVQFVLNYHVFTEHRHVLHSHLNVTNNDRSYLDNTLSLSVELQF